MNVARFALPLAAACLLAACATPAPLKGTYAPITPQQASATDATGMLVRWGGRVVSVEPQAQRTCFQMLATRLQGSGRPSDAGDGTGGRFIACRAGFYDPALFEKNREVTFTGRIEGYETRKIGEYDYRFPKLAADVVYLWPEQQRVELVRDPLFYPYMGWGPRWGWGMGMGWRVY
jgi:outer membrane lipoprotein